MCDTIIGLPEINQDFIYTNAVFVIITKQLDQCKLILDCGVINS